MKHCYTKLNFLRGELKSDFFFFLKSDFNYIIKPESTALAEPQNKFWVLGRNASCFSWPISLVGDL